MLGSGLFVLPGLAFSLTGPSLWLAYLVAGLLVLPPAISQAELATAMPASGGTYVYLDRTFGPLAGTIAGLGLWLALSMKTSFGLVGFGAYLAILHDFPLTPTALILLGAVVVMNLVGVRNVGRAQVFVVAIAVIALVLIVALSLPQVRPEHLANPFTHGAFGFVETIAFVYVAFSGLTKIAAIAEEVQQPHRNLPRSMLIALGLITLFYASVSFVLVGVVAPEQVSDDLRPVYTLAEAVGGPVLGTIAAVVGVLTIVSMANADVLASSRFPFAMARDRLLPSVIGFISPRFTTPTVAIVLTGLLMGWAIVALEVAQIAKLASAFKIVAFMAVQVALIVLRESDTPWYKPTFRSPLYPWIQLLGITAGAIILIAMGPLAALALVAMALPGTLLYVLYGRTRTTRRGIFGAMGRRRELLQSFHSLEQELPSEAAVVVGLVGAERSPERLVRLGATLASGSKVEVLHLTGVPEQIPLDEVARDDRHVRTLERRLSQVAKRHSYDIDFDAVVTRDVLKTVGDVTGSVSCQWLVIEWRQRGGQGITLFNPIGWLLNNLRCNLAMYRDVGFEEIGEILVVPRPGPHDALVADTANQIAIAQGAKLTFARWVPDSASSVELQSEADYLDQLAALSEAPHRTLIVRGRAAGPALTALSEEYDLLVLGASADRRLRDSFFRTLEDRLTISSSCSVLQVRTPRERTHAVLARRAKEPKQQGVVARLLDERCVQIGLEHRGKGELFAYFAECLTAVVPTDVATIEKALWEREKTQNTAIGHGAALPHATVAEAEGTALGIFRTKTKIDYQAPDGEKIDVFFVTIGPPGDRNTHLFLLAGIARMVLEGALLEKIRAAQSEEELIATIQEIDRQ